LRFLLAFSNNITAPRAACEKSGAKLIKYIFQARAAQRREITFFSSEVMLLIMKFVAAAGAASADTDSDTYRSTNSSNAPIQLFASFAHQRRKA